MLRSDRVEFLKPCVISSRSFKVYLNMANIFPDGMIKQKIYYFHFNLNYKILKSDLYSIFNNLKAKIDSFFIKKNTTKFVKFFTSNKNFVE